MSVQAIMDLHPEECWQKGIDDPACLNQRSTERYYAVLMDKGCDGFRVDMADSLVKRMMKANREQARSGKMSERCWMQSIRKRYCFEWNKPQVAIPAGFHMDFFRLGRKWLQFVDEKYCRWQK